MTKREAKMQALVMAGSELEAISQNNLGFGEKGDEKVSRELQILSESLLKRYRRMVNKMSEPEMSRFFNPDDV
jgi:hypothetical protein